MENENDCSKKASIHEVDRFADPEARRCCKVEKVFQ